VKKFPVREGQWVTEQESEDLRKVRVNADIAMCRANPGWFCVMFHCGEYLPAKNRWKMLYSVQWEKDSEPKLYHVMVGRILMADGSQVWGAVNG
jgi:hypothetical protein